MSNDPPQLFIKTLAGETITIDVQIGDTIRQIKQKIFEKKSYPVTRQKLISGGHELTNDSQQLTDDFIKWLKRDNVIHLILRADRRADVVMSSRTFQIFIETINGRSFNIDLQIGDSVRQVKRRIFRQEGHPVNRQRLIARGKELTDEERIDGPLYDYIRRHANWIRLVLTEQPAWGAPAYRQEDVQRERSFDAASLHMNLSVELRRLNNAGKENHRLTRALLDIKLQQLENPYQQQEAFDFDSLQPTKAEERYHEEKQVRRARQNIDSLQEIVAAGMASMEVVAGELADARQMLRSSVQARNRIYISEAISELRSVDAPMTKQLLQSYLSDGYYT